MTLWSAYPYTSFVLDYRLIANPGITMKAYEIKDKFGIDAWY